MGASARLDPAGRGGGGTLRRPKQGGPVCAPAEVAEGLLIAPHTHPKPEVVTIISGAFRFGMGETADRSKAEPLPAGSLFACAPGMAHFVSPTSTR